MKVDFLVLAEIAHADSSKARPWVDRACFVEYNAGHIEGWAGESFAGIHIS